MNASLDPNGVVAGLRVLDLTRVVAGPLAGQILGDLGADVIKIERPGLGDDLRHVGPWVKDQDGKPTTATTYFQVLNRAKRSITVDFTKPEGASLVRALVAQSDVLLENFREGTLASYGLDYASLAEINPRLIYCSITGFGQTGPYKDQSGYDFLMQGMTGVMSLTGSRGGGPTRVGVPITDFATGLNAVIGVLAALNFRTRTGRGQHVDVALFDCQVNMLLNAFSSWFNAGIETQRSNDHPSACPHGVFPTADGHIIVATMNDSQFARVAQVTGHPEWLEDARFTTNGARAANQEVLIALISQALMTADSQYWLGKFRDVKVPAGPINRVSDLEGNPQLAARDMLVEMEGAAGATVRVAGNPIKLSESPVKYLRPPPLMGEHTREVLLDVLNLTPKAIDDLQKAGAI